MPPPPNEPVLDELQSLNWRLLALEGDLQTRLERSFTVAGVRMLVPDGDEVARIEQELAAIGSRLAAAAATAGITLPDQLERPISRTDAPAAYAEMQRRLEHQRRRLGLTLERSPGAGRVLLDDHAIESSAVTGHLRRRLAHLGPAFIALPLILGLIYWAHASSRAGLREVAAQLCARPPPCPGDTMTIAHALGRRVGDVRHRPGLVLLRRSSDCSREVEVYHQTSGRFLFRGSLDDPDPAARAEFLAARERWRVAHKIASTVPCARAHEL